MSPGLDDEARRRAAATKRERTRAALIGAAVTLFNEQGYQVSMEDIATRAGVSVATAYNYFPSKDMLPGECLGPLFDDLDEGVRHDLNAETDPESAISRHLHDTVRLLQRNRRLVIAFMTAYLAHEGTGADYGFNLANTADLAHDLGVWTKLTKPLANLLSNHAGLNKFDVSERATTTSADNYNVSEFYTKALVMRAIGHPTESADQIATFVLKQLLPTAKKDT
jgi:AcrR family transcriptional regulator